jgi:hypothetical protein
MNDEPRINSDEEESAAPEDQESAQLGAGETQSVSDQGDIIINNG